MTNEQDDIRPVYLQGNMRQGGPIFLTDIGAIDVLIQPTSGRPSASVKQDINFPGRISAVHDSRGHWVRFEGEARDPSRLTMLAPSQRPLFVLDVNRDCEVMFVPQTPSAINVSVPSITVAAGVTGPISAVLEAGQRIDLSKATGPVRIGATISARRGDRNYQSAYVSLMQDRWLNMGAMAVDAAAALGQPVGQINYKFDGRQMMSESVRLTRPEGQEQATFRRSVAAFAESISTKELDAMINSADFGL